MRYFTFDIPEFWQDFLKLLKDTYNNISDPRKATPKIRNIDVGFIPLHNHKKETVGYFVPELYELAKVNGLRVQQEEANWQKYSKNTGVNPKNQSFYLELYHSNGVKKSPFELSVIPHAENNKKSLIHLQKEIEKEFNFRIENKRSLPPPVMHTQIASDYLKTISLIHLKPGESKSIKLNIINPSNQTTLLERTLHYLGKACAMMLIVVAILGVSYQSSVLFLSSCIAIMLSRWGVIEFSISQLVETLLRELKSFFSKEYLLGEKVSAKKTIKTMILLCALMLCTVLATKAAWTSVINISFWEGIGSSRFLLGSKYFLASFAAFMAALSALVSGFLAERFFWGIGIWDKQIDFTKEHYHSQSKKMKCHKNSLHTKYLLPILNVKTKKPKIISKNDNIQHAKLKYGKR